MYALTIMLYATTLWFQMVYDVCSHVCQPISATALYAISATIYALAEFWFLVRYSDFLLAIPSTAVFIHIAIGLSVSTAQHCQEKRIDRYHGPTADNYTDWWDESDDG